MDHFAGMDVSVKETSICIVDDTGRIVKEVKAASEPQALLKVLGNPAYRFKRIGLEAGPLSQWLFSGLAEAGLPVVCVETRHMQAVLKAQINKTDRNDARGIAQMIRVGLYRPVHVKTLRSQKLRMLLTHRKLLQSKAIAIENDLRGTLRNFGLKVGMVGKVRFEARIQELVENIPDLAVLVEPLLIVRRVLREQIVILHRRLLAIVREDEVCRRLMTTPGVGPVVALTYRATVDVPARFRKSKSVGAVFGLTCSRYQSGEIDWSSKISRCGDEMMRAGLYRPVHVKTLRSQKLRMLLTHRKLLQSKAIAIDNDLRGTLRNFGLKVGVVGASKFEARIRELVESLPDLAELVEPMLIVRRTLREQIGILHGRLLAVVRTDDVCRRLMTVPGVGPVVALTYRATVDVPARFRNSKAVGAVFGLTPSRYQSGEINRPGAISRCGDEMMRAML